MRAVLTFRLGHVHALTVSMNLLTSLNNLVSRWEYSTLLYSLGIATFSSAAHIIHGVRELLRFATRGRILRGLWWRY